ncbi:glycoside hydrolase family 27 protein [Parvularcula sp. LCG005]|uniref:glycoside hydrolase family 27 protein n=1 Tax=Parvularcula sp. LCG005 TaxID=3078805 RepID=UPI00397E395E
MAAGLMMTASLVVPASAQKFEGIADTPPMGWNSWNHFACNIDEDLIKQTADAMVESGMKDAGYVYVNIDDCWHGERDEDGFIQPHPERFPSGMKALADYVHEKGLKIGIYSDAGKTTCGGKPGSQGHEYQDALQYARWGIDYLKYDWCATGTGDAQRNPIEAYTTMRDALYAAGRPIVFSICEWGDNKPWEWGADIGHLWRTTGDIINCWDCEVGHGNWSSWGVMNILDQQDGLRVHAGPGHWNDPDMMEVGNLATPAEDRAHFTMWAMLAAPLIVGTDIRDMPAALQETLTNKEVIAVDQDALGVQGYAYKKTGNYEIWIKPLADGEWAMTFLNRSDSAQTITMDFAEDWTDAQTQHTAKFSEATYTLRDLWKHQDVGTTAKPFRRKVPPHDVVMVRLSK